MLALFGWTVALVGYLFRDTEEFDMLKEKMTGDEVEMLIAANGME